jgi:hypothetical protein
MVHVHNVSVKTRENSVSQLVLLLLDCTPRSGRQGWRKFLRLDGLTPPSMLSLTEREDIAMKLVAFVRRLGRRRPRR